MSLSDDLVPSPFDESTQPSQGGNPFSLRYFVVLVLCLILGIIASVTFLHSFPQFLPDPQAEEVVALRNQTSMLTQRIDQLEAHEKSLPPPISPEKIKELEIHLGALHQQIETLQNQPKLVPQHVEIPERIQQDLAHLHQTQQLFKSIILFWRLKEKVLSDIPYETELSTFKSSLKEQTNLSLLEKYASQGLKALEELPKDRPSPPLEQEPVSWASRLKKMTESFIKVNKVDNFGSPAHTFTRDREAIVDALNRLEQTLTQQLNILPLSLSNEQKDKSLPEREAEPIQKDPLPPATLPGDPS